MRITYITCWCYLRIYALQSYHLKATLEKIIDNKIKLVTSNCSCYNTSIVSLLASPFKYKQILAGDIDTFIRLPHIRNREGPSLGDKLIRTYRKFSEPIRSKQYAKTISDCDIAHFHQSGQAFDYHPIFYFLHNVRDCKKVVTIHNLSEQQWQNPSLNLGYNEADAIIVNNHYFMDILVNAGVESHKIHVIPYGAVLEPLDDYDRSGAIMFAGSPLIDVKGLQYVAPALRLLKEENVVIPLKLHGFHMRGHQEWANEIIKKENIDDQTEWLSIHNEDELIDAYKKSMICLVPYIGYPGSFPISMALSNGLPVIVGDTLGMPEHINGGGLVVKSKSVVDLASAIRKITVNEALRNEMGKLGRQTAEENFAWPVVAEKTLAIYEEIMGK